MTGNQLIILERNHNQELLIVYNDFFFAFVCATLLYTDLLFQYQLFKI